MGPGDFIRSEAAGPGGILTGAVLLVALTATASANDQVSTRAYAATPALTQLTDSARVSDGALSPEDRTSRTHLRLVEPPTPVTISIGADVATGGQGRFPVRSYVAGRALMVAFATSPILSPERGIGSLPYGLPLAAARLSSVFGWRNDPFRGGSRRHAGIDLAASAGSPVIATSDGVISMAGWDGGYGLLVSIAHGGGVQTRYGHLSRLNVAVGQAVARGDVIGFVGSTGRSTGPHVHYEVRVNGVAIDPLSH